MKAGSMVVCINPNKYGRLAKRPKGDPVAYTVSVFIPKGTKEEINNIALIFDEDSIQLEEIVNDKISFEHLVFSFENCYAAKDFRELLPPIEDVEEFINTNTLDPVLV